MRGCFIAATHFLLSQKRRGENKKKATECGGTTIRSYTSSLGVEGKYQEYLKVHTKVNQKCPVCGNTIKKIRVGGRGTYLCDNCQK